MMPQVGTAARLPWRSCRLHATACLLSLETAPSFPSGCPASLMGGYAVIEHGPFRESVGYPGQGSGPHG